MLAVATSTAKSTSLPFDVTYKHDYSATWSLEEVEADDAAVGQVAEIYTSRNSRDFKSTKPAIRWFSLRRWR
jgi:hypothetical protein